NFILYSYSVIQLSFLSFNIYLCNQPKVYQKRSMKLQAVNEITTGGGQGMSCEVNNLFLNKTEEFELKIGIRKINI
ncbi:hypothetical protein BpHYR1_029416, partial [Brachionus plicatilis]